MKLRPYQEQAINAIYTAWEQYRSTLLVLPTGCGKTIVFANVASELAGFSKILILAHREELLLQAGDKIQKACNMQVAYEKAKESALGSFYDITVGSVQTLMRKKRLEQFPQDYYDYIIIDEAHHALSNSYQNILNYFSSAKVLGVTATPDRGDKKNLGAVFENIAFEYGIKNAINNGYLSKILIETKPLKIDLSGVRITAGDYNDADIANALTPYLDEIARNIPKDRKTLVFLPLVATSKAMCEILKSKGFKAEHIDGKSEDRKEILERLANGKIDVLCNSMLLTEGFDEPSIDCIVNLRPTTSRALYAQIVGRGTRISEGKKNLLVLDFLWNSAKHDLINATCLIAPKADVAKKMTAISGGLSEPLELLELEEKAESSLRQEREESLAKKFKICSTKNGKLLDPLQYALSVHDDDLQDYEPVERWETKPPTNAQIELLKKNGFDENTITCFGFASKILNKMKMRKEEGLCTPKQMKILSRFGYLDTGSWSFETAQLEIGKLAANGWKRKKW